MDEENNSKTTTMDSDSDSIPKIVCEEVEVDTTNEPLSTSTSLVINEQLCNTNNTTISEILSESSSHETGKKSSITTEDDESVDNSSINDDEEYMRSTSSNSTSEFGDYDESSNSSSSSGGTSISSSIDDITYSPNKQKLVTLTRAATVTTKEKNQENENNVKNKLISKKNIEISEHLDDKPKPVKLILTKNPEQNKIVQKTKTESSPQPSITASIVPPASKQQRVLQAKISQNQLLLVTLVDSMDTKAIEKKITHVSGGEAKILTGPAKPIIATTTLMTTSVKENNNKNIDQEENIELKNIEINKKLTSITEKIRPSSVTTIIDDLMNLENDDTPSRTSTPKMKRELLQLQKTVHESKILTEYMHDSSTQKSRKTRKIIPLKHGDETLNELSIEAKASASRRSRSRSCSKVVDFIDEPDDKLGNSSRTLAKWSSDEKLNKRNGGNNANTKKIKCNPNERSETTGSCSSEPISTTTTIQSFCRPDIRRTSSIYEGDSSVTGDGEKSMDKWTSEEKLNKRTMRSQNLDFVQKQMKFLSRVNQDGDITDNSDAEMSINNDSKLHSTMLSNQLQIIEKTWQSPEKNDADGFCWKCHCCGEELISCIKCPRSFHYKCLKFHSLKSEKDWICVECVNLDNFIKASNKSGKATFSQEHLNQLLQFALNRAKLIKGHEYFVEIKHESECPDYTKYIKHPVTLTYLQEKVSENFFNTSEEFYSEAKWIQHNSFCYYGSSNKITNIAKSLVKVCRQEVNEIETCAECYLNANTRNDWFVEVCAKPHILLWAKLKGFPYWPAKAMGFNTPALVNVRFFGDHDRANVSTKECYLYSEINPNPATKQRTSKNSIAECIKEVDVHIEKLKTKFGKFNYAPFKTIYDPYQEISQLEIMIPGVSDYLKTITTNLKRPLTFKIVKTADNNLSMIKKSDENSTKLQSTINPINLNQSINSNNIKICTISLTTSVTTPTFTTTQTTLNNSTNLNIVKTTNSENLANNSNKPSLIIQKINNVNENQSKSAKSNIPVHSLESGCQITANTNGNSDLNKNSKKDNTLDKNLNMEITGNNNNESLTESYEVISKEKDSPVDIKKIQSLVIKRRYDNSSTTSNNSSDSSSTTVSKKLRNESTNADKCNIIDSEIKTTITDLVNTSITVATTSTTITKRKRSANDNNSSQPEKKPALNKTNDDSESQCPPLVLLNQQQSLPNTNNSTKISLSSANSGIIITPTSNINSTVTITSSSISTTATTTIANIKSKTPNIDNLIKNNKSVTITRISNKEIMAQQQQQQENIDVNKKIFLLNHNLSEKIYNDTPVNNSENKITVKKPTTSTPKTVNRIKLTNTSTSNDKSITSVTTAHSKLISSNIFPIPFIEIKTEKPDNQTVIASETANRTGSLEFVDCNTVKNTTTTNNGIPLQSQQITQIHVSQNPPALPISQNVEIKTEVTTDDEGQPTSGNLNTNLINNQSINSDISSNPIQNLQRISVRQFANIPCVQQVASQKTNDQQQKKENSFITGIKSSSQQKELQRARKSFPNKPLPVQSILPLSTNQSDINVVNSNISATTNNSNNKITNKNMNNMVYIPIDMKTQQQQHQQKSIPIPPLTAVTKINNLQHFSIPIIHTTINNTVTNKTTLATTAPSSQTETNNILNHSLPNSSHTLSPVSSSLSLNTLVVTSSINNSSNNNNDGTADHMLSGFVTPNLAAAITDTIVRGPPKLASRPSGPMQSDGDYVFPVEAGPVSRTLMENAHKMTDFFRSVIEDTIGDMTSNGILEAKIIQLQLEIEKIKNIHDKELNELKQNTDLMLCEMRNSMEKEKSRIITDTRKQCEIERIRSIDEIKKKQWCAMCGKEAQFYCCWNVSYCDYPCQQKHWPRHMTSCGQNETNHNATGNGETSGNTGQRIGVKISPYNVKDKNSSVNKNKEITGIVGGLSANPVNNNMAIPMRMPITSQFIRPTSIPIQRNPGPITIPIQRFNIPLPLSAAPNSAPPYTLVNREGNWELMGVPANGHNYQSRIIIPTTGSILVSDSTGKGVTTITTPSGMLRTANM